MPFPSKKYPSFGTSEGILLPTGQDLQQLVQDVIGGGMVIPDAPSDGNVYGRQNGSWVVGLSPVSSVAGKTGAVTLTHNDITDWGAATAGFLTGNQTVTLTGDVTGAGATTLATTLKTVNGNVGTFQGLTVNGKGLVTAAANMNYAPLNSPVFTGTPTAPTPAGADNSNNVATTAFVDAAVTQAVSQLSIQVGANKIINGDMAIDQRNNGASGTLATNAYPADRWSYVVAAANSTWQRVTADAGLLAMGFGYAISWTVNTAHTIASNETFTLQQAIESDMMTDFAWGTAGAQPVVLSFLARSSLTGTYSGALRGTSRSYPFTFNLPVANTWTRFTVAIPGDTVGPWTLTGSGMGVTLCFNLGAAPSFVGPAGSWSTNSWVGANGSVPFVQTAGANFQVSGVKLEIGTIATAFNRQSLAQSLLDCQRYFQIIGQPVWSHYSAMASENLYHTFTFPSMRTAPVNVAFVNMAYTNSSGIVLYTSSKSSLVVKVTGTAIGAVTVNAQGGITLSCDL